MLFRYGCINRKQVILQSSPYANTNLNSSQLVFRYTLGQFRKDPVNDASTRCMPELIVLPDSSLTGRGWPLNLHDNNSFTAHSDQPWLSPKEVWGEPRPVMGVGVSFRSHDQSRLSHTAQNLAAQSKKKHRKQESAGHIIRIRFYLVHQVPEFKRCSTETQEQRPYYLSRYIHSLNRCEDKQVTLWISVPSTTIEKLRLVWFFFNVLKTKMSLMVTNAAFIWSKIQQKLQNCEI